MPVEFIQASITLGDRVVALGDVLAVPGCVAAVEHALSGGSRDGGAGSGVVEVAVVAHVQGLPLG